MSRVWEVWDSFEKNTDAYILIDANKSKGKLLVTNSSW